MGDRVKRLLYVVGILLLGAIICSECRRTLGEKTKNMSVMNTEKEENKEEKIAYLTFDDGPSEVTLDILDLLKKKEVKATFFLVGKEITKQREATVKREVQEGHQVGVHTYSHEKEEVYCDAEFFFQDFRQCKERIESVTGQEVTLHRFPWGSNNGYVCPIVDDLMKQLKEDGIKSFDWNVSGEDSVRKNVPKAVIYQNVSKDLEKYEKPIILLHDSNATKNTAAVLGEIIDLIREKGYSFGTLNERDAYTFPASWR